jgi:hypothetical protein
MAFEIMQISTDEKFASTLKHVKSALSQFEGNSVATCAVTKRDSRTELSIVLNADKKATNQTLANIRRIVSATTDALADVVVTDMKIHYIASKLKLPIDDEINRHAFIKALSEFDSNTDKILARSLLKLTPRFLLDSFYDFMIDELKHRWNEVCVLANENVCFLVCNKTFSELLRFLISNIESRSDEVHIFARNEKIEILNPALKPFTNIYINEDLPPDIQVVTKLISIAPKRIFLHDDASALQNPLVKNIQDIFGACVHVVQR